MGHEHAWTWVDDSSDRMVCDDCGAEKLQVWNPDLGVYESTDVKVGAVEMEQYLAPDDGDWD